MAVKIKDVKVIYPDNTEELKRRYAKAVAKIIINNLSKEKIAYLLCKLKE